ncbi:SH3 domain-containing protein [Clostridium lundense]|uniref:SH3 domain-containing protein n=1 Tax=Clostridium lundense TaxID=319475 RepID=UPI000482D9A9|nr:SH3 domain-containing protein [Clostridium lundense]
MKKSICKVLSMLVLLVSTAAPLPKVKAAETTGITRSTAEQRALNMINLKWTYSSDKNGIIDPKYTNLITSPKQFTNVTTAEFTGIPYNWGGQDSLDSFSIDSPWTNFLDAINKGAHAGNVNTEAGYGYISGTAGIDCSGFVQATFNIKDYKLSTSTLFNKYFTKINLNDLKHMDILDKPCDHVVIFDKWGTLNGVYGAFTYESTTDDIYGGIQGTKKYFISMNEINKGYIPGRYVNIIEEPTTPPITPGIFAKVTNANDWINFRSGPSTDSATINTIPLNSIIYLMDYSSGWYKVNYNGTTGWIYKDFVGLLDEGKYVTVNGVYALNIRSNPSASSSILSVLYKNQYAEVIDYSNDGSWMKIRINGVEGWSSSKYLKYIY